MSNGCRRKACQVMSCQVNQWRALQIKTFDKTCEASTASRRDGLFHRSDHRAPSARTSAARDGNKRRHRAPTSDVARRKTRARDHGGIVTSFSDLPTAHAAAALRHPTQQRTKCRAVVCTLQVQHASQDTRTHAPTVALSSVSAAHCRDRVPCHICTPTRRTHLRCNHL